MTQDQVFVPPTRSQIGLPPLNADAEDLQGSRVSVEIMNEFKDAINDTPIATTIGFFSYLVSFSCPFRAQPLFIFVRMPDRSPAGGSISFVTLPVRSATPRARTVSTYGLLCNAGGAADPSIPLQTSPHLP